MEDHPGVLQSHKQQVPETTEMSTVVVKGILGSQERIQVHFLIGSMTSPCPWLQMGS